MYFLMVLLAANACLLAAYLGASRMDDQDRGLDVRLKRVVIPVKWRWLFRFRWSYSGDVLLIALIVEVTGLIFAFLLFCLGIMFTIFPFAYGGHVMFGIFMLYCFLLFMYSIIGVIQYSIKKRKYHKPDRFAKKCWSCEMEASLRYALPYRKVRVLDSQTTKDGRQIYAIQYGRWIARDFYAVTSKSYKPISGTYAKAIYTKKSPYFVLVSNWDEDVS